MFLLPYEYYHADAIVHIPHSFKKKARISRGKKSFVRTAGWMA